VWTCSAGCRSWNLWCGINKSWLLYTLLAIAIVHEMKESTVGYWFAVSMVSSLMMEVGRTIGFPMTSMMLKQGRRTHAQLKRLFSQYTAWFWTVGTTWQINEEFHIQISITRKRSDQWAQSRRGKDAHARRDAARTVDARRKIWDATVDVYAMWIVVPKECEGDVWVALE